MIWFDADTMCLIEIDFSLLIPVKVDAPVNDPMRITYDDDSKGVASARLDTKVRVMKPITTHDHSMTAGPRRNSEAHLMARYLENE